MYILSYNEDLKLNGFYKDGIHDNIPSLNINITNELWQYLLELGDFKLKSEPKKQIYSIKDIDLFEKVIPTVTDPPESQPTIDDRVAFLEKENADLMFILMMNGVI